MLQIYFKSNYKSHLISSNLLPLMMRYELADILYYIFILKNPTANFIITDFVIQQRRKTFKAGGFSIIHADTFVWRKITFLWRGSKIREAEIPQPPFPPPMLCVILHYFNQISTHFKLQHTRQLNNHDRHLYFCRFLRMWNSLPTLYTQSSSSLKHQLK